MRVEIIDDTRQRFNGKIYRRNKRGWYQTTYSTIHRDVWIYHNGAIPPKHDIHHIDGDKSNNQIENLACLTRKEHLQIHARENAEHRPPKKSAEYKLVCQKCGAEFIAKSRNAKYCPACRLTRFKKPPRIRECVVCKKPFEMHPKDSMLCGRKTCSPECAKILHKLNSDAQRVDRRRICPVCHREFIYNHASQKTCSIECGHVLTEQAVKERAQRLKGSQRVERVVSYCEFCGKEIVHLPKQKPRFCSRDCLYKYLARINRK